MTKPITRNSGLPIVVVGAGPVGLAAASELIVRGERPIVLEAGPTVGAAVREWGHVRLFSPWRYCISPAAGQLLTRSGWTQPDENDYPSGAELANNYLAPLATVPSLAGGIRLEHEVLSISRHGIDKMSSARRANHPFDLRVRTQQGIVSVLARAVIDASGTWRTPNPLGADGRPALGEDDVQESVFYGMPDVLGLHRSRYAAKRVLVVGRGHSAFGVLLDLVALRNEVPGTKILWSTRKRLASGSLSGSAADALPERGRLGQSIKALIRQGRLVPLEEFGIRRTSRSNARILVEANDGRTVEADEIVCATGFRPDLSLTRELRLRLDELVEAPVSLAGLIDPNVHSCGTVPPHGEAELAHPEPGYYAVGAKSYGRAPTFLMLTGYEQVRSIACGLTGDWPGARRLELALPETGVCSVDPPADLDVTSLGRSTKRFSGAHAQPTACCRAESGATKPANRAKSTVRRTGLPTSARPPVAGPLASGEGDPGSARSSP